MRRECHAGAKVWQVRLYRPRRIGVRPSMSVRMMSVDASVPGTVGVVVGEAEDAAAQMAAALLQAGVAPSVYGRSTQVVEALLEAGARWCGDMPELVAGCGLVVTAMPSRADGEALLSGLAGSPLIVIDVGTLGPRDLRAISAGLPAGIELLDVGQVDCRDGTTGIRTGGTVVAHERAHGLLSRLCADVRHAGALGSGRIVAGCHRIVEAVTLQAVAEALTLARRLGADPARVRSALAGGFAASHVLDVQGARMLARDFAAGHPAGEHADALGRMVEEAHALGLDLPATAVLAQQLNALVGAGDGGLDASALVRVLERMVGEAR